ncbi:AbfB domain-containing protein [Micromonospora radicis]|nr:AbfB domain-containing protein [Micromonospora radicis]
MSQGNDQSRLRVGGWISESGRLGSDAAAPATDQPENGTLRRRPAGLLRRTASSTPLTTVAPPSPARHPGGSIEAGRTIAPDAASDPATFGRPYRHTTPHRTPDDLGEPTDRPGPRRALLLGGVALVTVTALGGVLALRGGTAQETIHGEFVAAVPRPGYPADGPGDTDVPPLVDGTGSAAAPNGGVAPPAQRGNPVALPGLNPRAEGAGGSGTAPPASTPTGGGGNAPAPTGATPTTPGSVPQTPAGTALVPGARIGLEVAGRPGHRVRHFDFQAQVAPVNAASGSDTKADAAFTVRPGLTGTGCVAFESVNFPGHYLRHSGFRVFLHRAESDALFRADATFCPVTGLTGAHTSLRSYNYPDHYLRHDGPRQMQLSPVGDVVPASATFVVRPAL